MKRTKIGCSLQVSPLPSLPLPLCQCLQINCIYLQHLPRIYGLLYTVFLSKVSLYFSLHWSINSFHLSSVFISLQIFLIVQYIHLKCLSFYNVYLSIYIAYLSAMYSCLSAVHVYQQFLSFLLCLTTVFDYIQWICTCSVFLSTVQYIVYLHKLLYYCIWSVHILQHLSIYSEYSYISAVHFYLQVYVYCIMYTVYTIPYISTVNNLYIFSVCPSQVFLHL